jgi:trigger factor
LKVTTEDLGDRQVMLTIEVDEKRVESTLRGVARRIARQYNIPGFRRGRAPYHVILQRFGREALLQEALEDLGQQVYQDVLKDEELEPYAMASLEDIQLDPLVFKMRVPLQPTVDLGDYRQLRVEPPVASVEEEQISAELERLRQDNVILEPADDRPAAMGDTVTLDVDAEVDGEPYVHEEGYVLALDVEDQGFTTGFVEQVVGMTVDEEKQFTLTLPSDETQEERQEATYTVTLQDVKARTLPDLDDDLARTVGDFDTLDELRQDIYDKLEQKAQREADLAYTEEAIEALVAQATIAYPPDLIEDQLNGNVENMEKRLKAQGLDLDDYIKLSGQTRETFRESLRPQAEKSARRSLVLSELAYQEKLNIAEDEVDARLASLAAAWGEQAGALREVLSSPENVRSVANTLLADKVIQRLVAIVKGEAPSLEGKAEQAPEEETEEPQEAGPVEAVTSVEEATLAEESVPIEEAAPVEKAETVQAKELSDEPAMEQVTQTES